MRPFLEHLRHRAPGAEIIVVDGASSDGTRELAAGFCDRLVSTGARNRAAQMNAGARVAGGDVFWFLHADVEAPSDCLNEISRIMLNPRVSGGFFRIRLPPPAVYRLTDTFAHYAGLLLGMRCGDHGMFCRRDAFVSLNGFPEVPIMEDVEFFRRLRRHGPVVYSKERIGISARRYEAVGPLRLTLAYAFIATLYTLGIPLPVLARIYQRTCCVPERALRSKSDPTRVHCARK